MSSDFEKYSQVLAGVVTFCVLLLVVSSAQGASRDRNHDGLPDRWERKHGLSLKKNQRRLDQDTDRVSNLCEFQAGTDPLDADDDNDGIRDGREDSDSDGVSNARESRSRHHCGEDESDDDHGDTGATGATGSTGVIHDGEISGTVASLVGNVLTITLADGSQVAAPLAADAKIECEDSHDALPATGVQHQSRGGTGDDDAEGSDDDDELETVCGPAQLLPGAVVKEAEIKLGVFVEVELLA